MTNYDSGKNMTEGITVTEIKAVPEQLEKLLSGVAHQTGRHLREITGDLHQTRKLLEEAIAKLTTSFAAIHSAVDIQNQVINKVSLGHTVSPEEMEQAVVRSQEIRRHIEVAMVGLQFQDMTDQLLKRTNIRAAGVQEVFSALDDKGRVLMKRADLDTVGQAIQQLDEQLTRQSDGLHNALWKSVSQQHMECGDVDLF